jgi:hypothetical protein
MFGPGASGAIPAIGGRARRVLVLVVNVARVIMVRQ